jgi:uncharacterized membrane protein
MAELIVLRLLHVVGGVLWVGTGVFNGVYLLPALGASGPAAGSVIGHMRDRKLFTVLPIIALLTVLSGFRLMWLTSGGFPAAYFASTRGATYAAGGVAALIAFLLGVLVVRPAAVRTGQLAERVATADASQRETVAKEMAALRGRSTSVGNVVTVLLLASAAAMAVARYLG